MRKFLCLFLLLLLLPGCGDGGSGGPQSPEGKAVTDQAGGPFTEREFLAFIDILPSIPGLAAQGRTAPTGDVLSAQVKAAIKDQGWSEDRFTYIYGHAVSMLSLEQVTQTLGQMEEQMESLPEEQRKLLRQGMSGEVDKQRQAIRAEVDKMVPASEQAIIRAHLDELRSALGMPTP
ncbi:MAG: hypothetical protein V3571_14550 [Pseudodesulfovibrio sp.]